MRYPMLSYFYFFRDRLCVVSIFVNYNDCHYYHFDEEYNNDLTSHSGTNKRNLSKISMIAGRCNPDRVSLSTKHSGG